MAANRAQFGVRWGYSFNGGNFMSDKAWVEAMAVQLKLSRRLEAVEARLSAAEREVRKLKAAPAPKVESDKSFKGRVLAALGAAK
jgi:hypothetical protein